MNYSDNYNFKLPEGTDNVNIEDINDNFETIDGQTLRRLKGTLTFTEDAEDWVDLLTVDTPENRTAARGNAVTCFFHVTFTQPASSGIEAETIKKFGYFVAGRGTPSAVGQIKFKLFAGPSRVAGGEDLRRFWITDEKKVYLQANKALCKAGQTARIEVVCFGEDNNGVTIADTVRSTSASGATGLETVTDGDRLTSRKDAMALAQSMIVHGSYAGSSSGGNKTIGDLRGKPFYVVMRSSNGDVYMSLCPNSTSTAEYVPATYISAAGVVSMVTDKIQITDSSVVFVDLNVAQRSYNYCIFCGGGGIIVDF